MVNPYEFEYEVMGFKIKALLEKDDKYVRIKIKSMLGSQDFKFLKVDLIQQIKQVLEWTENNE